MWGLALKSHKMTLRLHSGRKTKQQQEIFDMAARACVCARTRYS